MLHRKCHRKLLRGGGPMSRSDSSQEVIFSTSSVCIGPSYHSGRRGTEGTGEARTWDVGTIQVSETELQGHEAKNTAGAC